MKDSLRKLRLKNTNDLHIYWFDRFNAMAYYTYRNVGLCTGGCGICHGRWLCLLNLFIRSLNGCEDSLELLGDLFEGVVVTSVTEEFRVFEQKVYRNNLAKEPTYDEIDDFLGVCFVGLRSSIMFDSHYGIGVAAKRNERGDIQAAFSRKFMVWLDSVAYRERIHCELEGSRADQFLKDMELHSGDYTGYYTWIMENKKNSES